MEPVILRPGIGDNRPTATLYYGRDVRETLRTLPEASVHTVCTSPPYFGLRDYGTGDAQIGLEATPEDFVAALVDVFREVKRVLRPDGTLWVNLGDSYAGGGGFSPNSPSNLKGSLQKSFRGSIRGVIGVPNGLKPKDLIGIPWRVAFALQADGWYLRQDIIWAKGYCMPESVTDRCTKSHEYVFLFAHPDSGGRYFYDAEAVKETAAGGTAKGNGPRLAEQAIVRTGGVISGGIAKSTLGASVIDFRNRRSVWTVNPKPYKGSHFATWPPELVRPMILAGTSALGCCSDCGAPWKRASGRLCPACEAVVPTRAKSCPSCGHTNDWKGGRFDPESDVSAAYGATDYSTSGRGTPRKMGSMGNSNTISKGWMPACDCTGASLVPATVLDPFSGSATTGMVALQEGRNYLGCDLNPDYLPMAEARVREEPPPVNAETQDDGDALDLFADG